jgi:hypothetical protein
MRGSLMLVLSTLVGLAVAGFDHWADKGEASPGAVLLLLLLASVCLGVISPVRPWRWAVCAAIWLPVALVGSHALGAADHVQPNTFTARALVLAPALATALLGAYAGAGVRRLL